MVWSFVAREFEFRLSENPRCATKPYAIMSFQVLVITSEKLEGLLLSIKRASHPVGP